MGANIVQDAVYPSAFVDREGNPLSGANRYVLHFDKEQMPPSQRFLVAERHLTQINCSGAIYDKHDSGSRAFLIGAPYLTDERSRHKPSANQKQF